ncbi:MAG: YwaF family protein [Firmicutes bacterium]|nr:YwaF family protein [Bacillota bacterium]
MFTPNHFVLLAISAVGIAVTVFLSIKFEWKFRRVLFGCLMACAVSELTKIFMHFNVTESGGVYNPGSLPFHLCSMQIFFLLFVYFVKNERVRKITLAFLFPTMAVGATAALLIPTVGVNFDNPEVWTSFMFHAMLIFFAIYLVATKQIEINLTAFLRNLLLLGAVFIFSIWVNSILSVYGTNFLYVVGPPMDNLPLLNLDNGYYAYLFTLIGVALVLMVLIHVPFIIAGYVKKKRAKPDAVD